MANTVIGQQLSRFEILSRIIESPDGDVYKARDTQTGGLFALKTLPAALTADPERRRRIQEAVTAAAAVSHPNLAHTYELDTADGVDFLVSELVEGEPLDQILRRERLHRRDLYSFARQIVAALGAAHEAGLVHGGLCGACILLDRQRRIKVLDCGLSRALRVSEDDTPPDIACYFSPEQVEGEELDERSDVFSFGALLYYMSSRRRPFRKDSLEATRLAILKEEPKPLASVTSRAPRGVEKIVKRCLRKSPGRRYRHIADVDQPLSKLEADYRGGNTGRSSRFAIPTGVLTGLLVAIALGTVAGIFYWSQNISFKSRRDDASQITLNTGFDSEPAISSSSPQQVAYASDQSGDGNLDIWIQPVSGLAAVRLTRDPADDHEPAISLDGFAVAFRSERAGGGIYQVPSIGGEAKLLAAEGRRPRYSPDGTQIAYWAGQADGAAKLYVIPATGGKPRQIAPGFAGAYPVWSPDGASLLFLGNKGETISASAADWWLAPVGPGEPKNTGACHSLRQFALLRADFCVAPGDWKGKHVFFSMPEGTSAHVWREEMLPTRELIARPDQLTAGDSIDAQPAASADGRVLFSRQTLNVDIWGAPIRANEGKLAGDWKKLTTDPAVDDYPSASADGQKLVFQSDRRGARGAWLLNMNSRLESPIPSDRKMDLWPRISPDGLKFSFAEEGAGKFDSFYLPVAGGNAQRLCNGCGPGADWSHDSKRVLIEDTDTGSISMVKPGSTHKSQVFPGTGARLYGPRFSPDEKWIAFTERTGAAGSRVFFAPMRGDSAGTSNEWLSVTKDNTWESAPQWSPDGELLYFVSNRDGRRCVWARRVREVKASSGEPFAVAHFHDSRRSPDGASFHATDLFVGANQMMISLGELSGSVYMIKPTN